MSPLTLGEAIALFGVGMCAIGLIMTWRRNGREQNLRDGKRVEQLTEWKTEIKTEVAGVIKELESKEHGLQALASGLSDFKQHCASISGPLGTQVDRNASDIQMLIKNGRKKE